MWGASVVLLLRLRWGSPLWSFSQSPTASSRRGMKTPEATEPVACVHRRRKGAPGSEGGGPNLISSLMTEPNLMSSLMTQTQPNLITSFMTHKLTHNPSCLMSPTHPCSRTSKSTQATPSNTMDGNRHPPRHVNTRLVRQSYLRQIPPIHLRQIPLLRISNHYGIHPPTWDRGATRCRPWHGTWRG